MMDDMVNADASGRMSDKREPWEVVHCRSLRADVPVSVKELHSSLLRRRDEVEVKLSNFLTTTSVCK